MLDESFLLVLAPKLYNEAFWHALLPAPQITNFTISFSQKKEWRVTFIQELSHSLGGQNGTLNKLWPSTDYFLSTWDKQESGQRLLRKCHSHHQSLDIFPFGQLLLLNLWVWIGLLEKWGWNRCFPLICWLWQNLGTNWNFGAKVMEVSACSVLQKCSSCQCWLN